MSTTTADRLALLLRTKQWQRRELEKRYPSLDFDEIPFSAYRQLWMGRAYVPGLVGAWNAYGRSNSDADRDVLYDYSGNGRDIKLYNFDFTESSGYSEGGLVSDGVDDYGQCVKGFALPDDYTVVAVRRYIEKNTNDGALVAKSRAGNMGSFLLEQVNGSIYSYGNANNIGYNNYPPLFVYQTKTSYCGMSITPGTDSDSEDDILTLFIKRPDAKNTPYKAVLYDLRIYDHSLTAEELQIVKDEMMQDYEKNAKPLEGITYVADWDAKGRSNDEDADVRDKWIDKATGKVLDLHNYAFAAGSGWNGYAQNWNDYLSTNSRYITRTSAKIEVIEDYTIPVSVINIVDVTDIGSYSVKVSGMKSGDNIYYYHYPSPESTKRTTLHITEDGTYDLPATYTPTGTVTDNPQVGFWGNVSEGVTIEQLPLYPGALVSDGVDDYGQSAEAISEEVGTMLAMIEADDNIKAGSYFFNCGKNENANRLYCWKPSDGIPKMGLPSRNITLPIGVLTRTPASPSDTLHIASYSTSSPSKMALYCLILIREQLDDAQVDFLKWKVEKEYRDWCTENGYEYAINQLTA